MKKIYYILSGIVIIIIAAYMFVRYHVLKTNDIKPDASKSTSLLDLRPEIIAKLQQLVKDGSNGLYNLSIEKIDPDIIASTVKIKNAKLIPDSNVLASLDKAHLAPDDVFKISFDSLDINGIGIKDLLNTDKINLKTIFLNYPVIDVYHTDRIYNKKENEKNDSLTLYQKLMKTMKKISIDTLYIEHGIFVNHNISKDKATRFNDVSLKLADILIDSTTQYDKERFLFAKEANILLHNYSLATGDSLYYLKASSVNISAAKHSLIANEIAFTPRGDKEQFEKKLKSRQDMFTIKIPSITFDDIDWYNILNGNKIIINEGTIEHCDFYDYFDRTIPVSAKSSLNNFPEQLLMRMNLPIYIKKINLKKWSVTYEELNPNIHQTGIINFSDLDGEISNITNIPEYIKKDDKMMLKASAVFLHATTFSTVFSLNLKDYKQGHFIVDASLGEIDSTAINPVSRPLGLIAMKTGKIKKVSAHVIGTNTTGKGSVVVLYNDLHVEPLKKQDNGKIKKRGFLGFLANFLLVKNDNPSNGNKPRKEDCDYKRDSGGSFFNLIWKTILTGILKTIGIPVSFAYK